MRDHEGAEGDRHIENSTVRMVDHAIDRVLGMGAPRRIVPSSFDAEILLPHPDETPPAPGVEFSIARALRDGRDFDPSLPCDWHVTARSVVDEEGIDVDPDHGCATSIMLNRSFRAPAGYQERG